MEKYSVEIFNVALISVPTCVGNKPSISFFTKSKKGNSWEMATLDFHSKKEQFDVQTSKKYYLKSTTNYFLYSYQNGSEYSYL